MIAGILGAAYVGFWLMFIQPILNACQAFDAGTLTGMVIGVTILKCIFAGSVGMLIFFVSYYIGSYLYFGDYKK